MSYPYDYTYDLALERIYKDEQQKRFRKSKVLRGKTSASRYRKTALSLRGVFDDFDGIFFIRKDGTQEQELLTLDVLYNLKQKNKIAELNAYTEAFINKTQKDDLTPLFITTTVSPEHNIVKSEIDKTEECLKKSEKQYEMFDRFWNAVLTDRLFRNPKTAKTLSDSYKDWYYIPAKKRPYLKSSELTSFKSSKRTPV